MSNTIKSTLCLLRKKANFIVADIIETNERRQYRPQIIPPASKRRGSGIDDYISGGKYQLERLVELAGLNPQSDLLDIGCGDGRLASALTAFINGGSYATFEVQKRFIDFLTRNISRKYPEFVFKHADLYHSYYNPAGAYQTTEYIYPFESNSFDLAYLNSIFSHFLPDEIAHYLGEIHRVLRPKGIVMATYLIANEEALSLDRQGLAAKVLRKNRTHLLNFQGEHYWARDEDVKEKVVAIDETWLRNQHAANHLPIEKIIWGDWCGRAGKDSKPSQDIIIAHNNKV